ncbi:MAG: RNA 2'-phosphotransferase [Leptotrichiaceae bacterium]|nr:RNA 2'-phosphotransferase [Leptotrichiaceae bacterium]
MKKTEKEDEGQSTELKQLSKFISLILRHSPDEIKIKFDKYGWADIEELIGGINKTGNQKIDFKILEKIVNTDDKKRYQFNEGRTKIRACQGHSLKVELELEPVKPPKILYHGTAERNMVSIKREGLKKGNRQYVHLSEEIETVYNVGKRHGKPCIIIVMADKMYKDGKKFYVSKNKVWLTENIETEYLKFPK